MATENTQQENKSTNNPGLADAYAQNQSLKNSPDPQLEKNINTNQVCPTPKKENLSDCNGFSFGTIGTGVTSMNIFFSDGTRDFSMTPAKYLTILKEMDRAESRKRNSLIVPIVINKANGNGSGTIVSQYAKIKFGGSAPNESSSRETRQGIRVLLCEYYRTTTNYIQYKEENSYGMYVSGGMFKDVKTMLHANVHALNIADDDNSF